MWQLRRITARYVSYVGCLSECLANAPQKFVNSICFTQAGDRLICGFSDNSIRLWDPRTMEGHASISMANHDTRSIVALDRNSDLEKAGKSAKLPLYLEKDSVTCVVFNGSMLASSSKNGQVRIWRYGAPLDEAGPPLPSTGSSALDNRPNSAPSESFDKILRKLTRKKTDSRCACGHGDDGRTIVCCHECGNWDHAECFYRNHPIPDVHQCLECFTKSIVQGNSAEEAAEGSSSYDGDHSCHPRR